MEFIVDIVKGQLSKLYADALWRKLAHRCLVSRKDPVHSRWSGMLPKGKLLREHPAPLAVQDVQHSLLTAIWHFRLCRLGTVNSNSGNELHEKRRESTSRRGTLGPVSWWFSHQYFVLSPVNKPNTCT